MKNRNTDNKNTIINILNERLRHLLQSKTISQYDEKKNGKYIKDIYELDKIIENNFKTDDERYIVLKYDSNSMFSSYERTELNEKELYLYLEKNIDKIKDIEVFRAKGKVDLKVEVSFL